MSKIVIGKAGHAKVSLDLSVLLSTRMLLTADSGGGKTWALKRICEQAAGKIQIIIVDPEGEFSPLREKLPFLLAGKGGETPADTRSAALLALRLLETRASCICDIFEMKPSQRHLWVRLFLEGLIEAPKATRHPVLVIVDESHIFCPEKGKGESEASEAMISLCTRGRKRLLCSLFATQRLATLNKDASSMLLNRMIGPTFEDLNRKRAMEVLSIAPEDKTEFNKQIQLLEPGNFFVLGRAITRERTLVHIGPIETPHGLEAMKYDLTPPPPPDQVKALLPKLADLPAEAEEKAKTVAEFKKEISSLKAQLRAQPKQTPVQVPVFDTKQIQRSVHTALTKYGQEIAKDVAQRNAAIRKLERLFSQIHVMTEDTAIASISRIADRPLPPIPGGEIQKGESHSNSQVASVRGTPTISHHPRPDVSRSNGDGELTRPQMRVLSALAEFAGIGIEAPSRSMVASWLGVKAGTGSFKNYLSELRTRNLIADDGPIRIGLTDEGRAKAPQVDVAVTTEELLRRSESVLGRTAASILRIAHQCHPEYVRREVIADQLGISPETGSFKNYISELRTAGMIEDGPEKSLKAADWLFIG